MFNLDETSEIEKLDSGKVIPSIESLPKQILQAWQEVNSLEFPIDYKNATNIVVSGMGGSTLGTDVLKNLYKEKVKVPLVINNHYHLPGFVNENSLVIISSYSGTTEEALAALEDAARRKAKIFVITEGNNLGERTKVAGYPSYIFNPVNNPSQQPRLGVGYTFIGILAALVKLGLLNQEAGELSDAVTEADGIGKNFYVASPREKNSAKEAAAHLFDTITMIVASEFLSGNAHIFANQINENSKSFAAYFLIPELNHHLLEGNTHPESVKKDITFFFLESALYSEKIQKRIGLTQEILEKQKVPTQRYQLTASTQLAQVFEGVMFSSWTTFYLGMLNGVDTTKIPWVDYFKEQLAKK